MRAAFRTVLIIVVSAVGWIHGSISAETPNVLLIVADDLGYGDVQCLNPQRGKIATPNLDRLASQGMTFADAHSGSSVCTPTRYGLLTGRYAWRTRLQKGVLDGGNDEPLIAEDRLTVAGLLRQHGYSTACIGKWHLGFQSDAEARKPDKSKGPSSGGLPLGARIIGGPTTRGFDYFWGCSNARTMSALIENDRVIEILPPEMMLSRLTEVATKFVSDRAGNAKSGRPFFLYVPLTSPHTPIVPTSEWQGKSGLGAYADFVMQTDDCVGRILSTLDREGIANDTLVIFTSDNGCSPAAKTERLEAQGHSASAHFRGYKADIWEGGHRVPFMARWPGRVAPKSSSNLLLCLTDLMRTLAEIVDYKLSDSQAEDSFSFLPALVGQSHARAHKAIVHHSLNGVFAIRHENWKLSFCPGSGGWGQPTDGEAVQQGLPAVQLYDLSTDPSETTNRFPHQRDRAKRLSEILDSYLSNGRSTPGMAQKNDILINAPNLVD